MLMPLAEMESLLPTPRELPQSPLVFTVGPGCALLEQSMAKAKRPSQEPWWEGAGWDEPNSCSQAGMGRRRMVAERLWAGF